MDRYALVQSGKVINVVESNSPISGWIKVTGLAVGPGYSYNGSTFSPPPPRYRKVLTGLEWVETWTPDEWRQLKTASQGTTAIAKRLDQLLDGIKLTGAFNLESATATTFYNFLESNGYITAQRKAELTAGILENP